MVDRILREVYRIEKREIIFENKKPKLLTGEKHFSISHTKEYIALAFSDSNCGIDIEKNVPREFEKVAKRMNFEVKTLGDFYKAWTEFEAKYKLGAEVLSKEDFLFENYTITAVSENPEEKFDLFIQNN